MTLNKGTETHNIPGFEGGATSQGMRAPPELELPGKGFSLKPPEGTSSATPGFEPSETSDTDYETGRSHLCCFQPLNLE